MKEFSAKATLENISAATEFVDNILDGVDCNMKSKIQIDVAIDEILSNIVHYAYKGNDGDFSLRIIVADNVAVLDFFDSGIPYNPLDKDDPNTSLSAEEREIGGLGIFMVKSTMDDIKYEYTDGKNHLTIIKNLK